MTVTVFGLGYVGLVLSCVLAEAGHDVQGVDINSRKIEDIDAGISPISEPQIPDLVRAHSRDGSGRLNVETTVDSIGSLVTFICVGTPSATDGSVDVTALKRVCETVGDLLHDSEILDPTVVIRSTVSPQILKELVIPTLTQRSNRQVGASLHLVVQPEFLREGSAVHDFYHPPKTVLGPVGASSVEAVKEVYQSFRFDYDVVSAESAAFIKYIDNSFHALKVAFANEMGGIASSYGVPVDEVMALFRHDTILNISDAYLRPGLPFGGSCLPKDVRALCAMASKAKGAALMSGVLEANADHLDRIDMMISDLAVGSLGFIGLAFKGHTDDVRESPLVELMARSVKRGNDVKWWDNEISLDQLVGANLQHIESAIPDYSRRYVAQLDQLILDCRTIVVGQHIPDIQSAFANLSSTQVLIDLVGLGNVDVGEAHHYELFS